MKTHKAIFKGIVNQFVWESYDNVRELEHSKSELNRYYDRLRSNQQSRYYDSYDNDIYTKAIIRLQKEINEYKHDVTLYTKAKFLNYENIWSGDLPRPVLEVGEEIYINDLDIIVRVKRKYRTTNDEVMYETDYEIKTIKTEETEKTRLKAVEEWFKSMCKDLDKFEQLKSEFIVEEQIIEEPVEPVEEPWKPAWEQEKKKEKSWFGWLKK